MEMSGTRIGTIIAYTQQSNREWLHSHRHVPNTKIGFVQLPPRWELNIRALYVRHYYVRSVTLFRIFFSHFVFVSRES